MKSIKQILDDQAYAKAMAGEEKGRYVSREWQDYGYRLSKDLSDDMHKSLYIKLAKTVERGLLEQARRFAVDSNADKKGALFMWKLSELRKKVVEKRPEE